MTSWQTTFYLQFILEKYDKEESKNQKIIQALVSYHSPETIMKFIMAKGNPQMLPPNVAFRFYSIIIEYCLNIDYQISATTLLQILEYLLKILQVRQTPKFFQKIEPLFFIVFSNTVLHYNEKERDLIYNSLKNISILALSFYSFSPLALLDQKQFIRSSDQVNIIASKTFSEILSLIDSYITTSKHSIRICTQSLTVLFKSSSKIEYDLLTLYSLCDKISKIEPTSTQAMDKLPLYFKANFFNSLSYFLSPLNSLQIAKTHFFTLSQQIASFCTVEDLISVIEYSKRLIDLRKSTEITAFTVDMITEIVFSTILPHFRKSSRLESTFKDFCDMLDEKKMELFVNTHFTTASDSAKRFLLSEFPNDDQNIEVLFTEPIDSERIHLYLVNTHQKNKSKAILMKYLVHFFEFANLNDFQFLIDVYGLNEYLFCAKTIQYLSICEEIEKMKILISFLMNDQIENVRRPIVIYSNDSEYQSVENDSTSVFCLDLAFLTVLYQTIQNPKLTYFFTFLEYLKKCKENSMKNSYSKQIVEAQFKSPKKCTKNDTNLEKTPTKTPKKKRRLSNENVEDEKKTKRRLSDQSIDHPTKVHEVNLLFRQFSQKKFSLTPQKLPISTNSFKTKFFKLSEHHNSQIPSHQLFKYIERLIDDVSFWNESLLSLLYTKIEKGELHFGVLVSFFTDDFTVINQIGKIISPVPKVLKLFFAVTLSNNNRFLTEIMKYIFFHGDLVSFRIDIVLHSVLVASQFIQTIDDRLFEIFSVGLVNEYYDLTCTTISSLFNSFNENYNEEEEYFDDEIDSDERKRGDPELFLMKFCNYKDKCENYSFYTALKGILNCCYKSKKYQIENIENIQILITTIVDTVIQLPDDVDIDIEEIFFHIFDQTTLFVNYLSTVQSKEIGYFNCLNRVSQILSIDHMKPLLSKLFLNYIMDLNHSKCQNCVLKILKKLFDCEFNLENQPLKNIDQNLASFILNTLFTNVNNNDEFEKKSCEHFFQFFSMIYPKTVIEMQPSPLIQLIELNSDNFDYHGSLNYSVFSVLAETDLVLFFNQLANSHKCDLYDQIIFNLCRCPDPKFELFTCIENEFLELRYQSINFSFAFQILSNYLQFRLISENINGEKISLSILFIFFLVISEFYLTNNNMIFEQFLDILNLLEIYFGFPLMSDKPPETIEKVFDVIPFPLFSNSLVFSFFDKLSSNLKQTKHFQNYELLIESMILIYSNTPDVFIKLIDLYLNEDFSHLQFNSISFQNKLNQKRLSVLSKSVIEKLFDLSIQTRSIEISINCSQVLNQPDNFRKFVDTYFNTSDQINIELNSNHYHFFKKLFQHQILDRKTIFIKLFECFTNQLFSNDYSLELFELYFQQNLQQVFDSFFFFCIEFGNIYLELAKKVISLFNQLELVTEHELEICFYFLSPLFELVNDDVSAQILDNWIMHLEEKQMNKGGKAITKSLVEQYQTDRTSLLFPTIIIKSSELYHI